MPKTLEEERKEADRQIAFLKAQLARNVAGEQTFTQHPNMPDDREGIMLGLSDWVRERDLIAKLETKDKVTRQLDAMGVQVYTVGVLTVGADGSKRMERFAWDKDRLLQSLPWLKSQNASGANINIGPTGEHGLSLIDDLKRKDIQKMKDAGFQPALVVETSRNNYQAWVNHGQVLGQDVRGAASKRLAQTFDGDPSAAAHNHLGRLAGFTNRKEIHRSEDGKYPWVHLVEANGQVYPRAKEFIASITEDLKQAKAEEQRRAASYVSSTAPERLKTIADFRNDLRYAGDGNRVDIAYARYALSHGVSPAGVKAEIRTRDLTKKGPEKSQEDYIKRTLEKASQGLLSGMGR